MIPLNKHTSSPLPTWQHKIHQMATESVIGSLRSSASGLSSDEASRRLNEFGPNSIQRLRREPMLWRFLRGFTHFFALILWCGAAIAFFAEWKQPGSGMAVLGCAIGGVIVINGVFSFWQEFRAQQAIDALQELIPHQAKVFRDGQLMQVDTAGLVPGDAISIEEGDDIPADCRLLEATSLRVNNATITGESASQARNVFPSIEDDVVRSKNVLLAGTSVATGHGKAIVFATGMHTEFGQIASLTQTTHDTLSPLQKEIVRLSRVIAAIALTVGACFFFVGRAIGISFWDNAIFALGIIVALVPEGLLPEVTLALATCSQRMAKRNALVRHLPSVETLGCANVICTDKTGTLTQNHMTVRRLYLCQQSFDVEADQSWLNTAPVGPVRSLCNVALNCQSVRQAMRSGTECLLGDPMEIALMEFARVSVPSTQVSSPVDEVPFDSDRKRLSTLHSVSNGFELYSKGALETMLPLCQNVCGKDEVQPLSAEIAESFQQAEKMMADDGLRVLAFASRSLAAGYDHSRLEQDLTLIGLIGLEDPPRTEVPSAIQKCKQAGIKVIMVTGDHPATAQAIAREIGLLDGASPLVITGSDLRKMSDAQLHLSLDARQVIFARSDADQKMRIVNALKQKKQIVAVTGDGVNDAPALKAADIGIAMGISGTDVARQAADMILADDNFASIVNAIEEGRGVFANIRKFLTYVLASNIAELIPCLAFVLFRIPLPLTVIQILSVDLGTDLLPALALGTEKPDATVMQRPPRLAREGLFDVRLLARAYLFLGLMVSLGSMAAYFFVLENGGWTYGQQLARNNLLYLQATTACLIGIICMQIINSSMCRSERESIFSLGPFSNRLLLFGVCTQLALIVFITYTPWGNAIFRTAPIRLSDWACILPFMLGMILVEEGRKWLMRRRSGGKRRDPILSSSAQGTKDTLPLISAGEVGKNS